MNDLQKEIMRVLDLHELGKPIYAKPGKDGISRADFIRSEPEPLRAPLRQAEPQSLEKTMQDIPAVAGGIAGGVGVGLGEAADLGIGLLEGAYKALNPDAGEGRFQSFVSGLAEQFETGYGEQARSIVMDMGEKAGLSPEQLDVMDESITAGSMLSIGGATKKAAQAVPGMMSKAGDVIEGAGEGAKARMAEGGATLGAGVDPDPLIAGAGDAVAKFRAPTEKQPGVIAFHGSGADFDEFKLEKIGTGEGAQAYGYGLYFTDSESIAKFYRDTIASRDAMHGQLPIRYKGKKFAEFEDSAAAEAEPDKYRMLTTLGKEIHRLSYSPKLRTPENAKKQLLARLENEIAQQRNLFKNESADVKDAMEEAFIASLQRDVDALEQINPADVTIEKTGKMYKVGLEPKPEDMLDYEKSISEQSQKVQDALYANEEIASIIKRKEEEDGLPVEFYTGEELYADLAENLQSPQAASSELADAGIFGLKYDAAGSRGDGIDAADVKKNYVIFDDKMIKILEKYGIVGPVAITGIAASQQEGEGDGRSA